MHALGSWALERKQQGKLESATWTALVPYLVGAAPDAQVAARLLQSVWSDQELDLLERWQRAAWDGEPGWEPADARLVARFWATLLLVRVMPTDGSAPEIDLGSLAPQLGPEVLDDIQRIETESPTWDDVVGGDMAVRIGMASTAVREAVAREVALAERRLVEAPLDLAKVEAFADLQRRTYEAGDYLRRALMTAGAVKAVFDDDAFAEAGLGRLMSKRPFVNVEGSDVLVAVKQLATDLVWEQLQATYAAITEYAEPWESEEDIPAAVQAIAALRNAGHRSDAVLLPRDPFLRAAIGRQQHPEWSWSTDFMQQKPEFGTLCGVPVYDPGPREATALVVCELGTSVRKLERRPKGAPAVRVMVEPIGKGRAEALVEASGRAPGVPDERDAQMRAMHDGYVEVHVDMDVQWERPRNPPTAWRIQLPSVDDRQWHS